MDSCVYCGGHADGVEHWFPKGLGAIFGCDTLRDRICDHCNRALGRSVDQEFLRTGPTGFARAAHGIRRAGGGSQQNPFFYRAGAEVVPTETLMPSTLGPHEILGEAHPHETGIAISPMRQVVFKRPSGEVVPVAWNRLWTAEQLRLAIATKGCQAAELIEVYLDEDERPDSEAMRLLLRDAGIRTSKDVNCAYGGNSGGEKRPVKIRMGINRSYIRGIGKLAFHYGLWASKLLRGNEDEFGALRKFVFDGDGDWREFVLLAVPPFVPDLRQTRPTRLSHFFHLRIDQEEVRAGVHLFVRSRQPLPPASLVRLGRNPLKVVVSPVLYTHRIWYYQANEPRKGYSGEIETIDTTVNRIIRVTPKVGTS